VEKAQHAPRMARIPRRPVKECMGGFRLSDIHS